MRESQNKEKITPKKDALNSKLSKILEIYEKQSNLIKFNKMASEQTSAKKFYDRGEHGFLPLTLNSVRLKGTDCKPVAKSINCTNFDLKSTNQNCRELFPNLKTSKNTKFLDSSQMKASPFLSKNSLLNSLIVTERGFKNKERTLSEYKPNFSTNQSTFQQTARLDGVSTKKTIFNCKKKSYAVDDILELNNSKIFNFLVSPC